MGRHEAPVTPDPEKDGANAPDAGAAKPRLAGRPISRRRDAAMTRFVADVRDRGVQALP